MKKKFDFTEYWALEFKKDPKRCRKMLNEFIDAQIDLANARLSKLSVDQLKLLFDIKNREILAMLKEKS